MPSAARILARWEAQTKGTTAVMSSQETKGTPINMISPPNDAIDRNNAKSVL